MIITKKKNRIAIHLSEFPTESELKRLNSLGNSLYFMDTVMLSFGKSYKRLLVTSNPNTPKACTMECPINETFYN